MLRRIFGAHGQLVVGVVTLLASFAIWGYGAYLIHTGQREKVIELLFHASMFYGCVACYSIIATALGYRATERVEARVVENIAKVDKVVADKVEVEV